MREMKQLPNRSSPLPKLGLAHKARKTAHEKMCVRRVFDCRIYIVPRLLGVDLHAPSKPLLGGPERVLNFGRRIVMAHHRAALKKSDLTRYASAMRAAGFTEFRVVVRPDGSHEIVAGKIDPAQAGPNPDELLK